jgi:signal transduction histidine kinase
VRAADSNAAARTEAASIPPSPDLMLSMPQPGGRNHRIVSRSKCSREENPAQLPGLGVAVPDDRGMTDGERPVDAGQTSALASSGRGRTSRQSTVTGVLLSLWRAAAVFRICALGFCLYLIVRWRNLYAEPAVAFGVAAAMVLVTGLVAAAAGTGRAHRASLVLADVIVCAGLTALSRLAQRPSQFHGSMPTLTSVWAAGPAIEVGLLFGSAAGVLAGLVQFAASVFVRDGYDGRTLANGVLLVLVGGIAGYLTRLSLRAERERAAAAAERARLAERDRLTRSIHDGVLQVLGLVHRRGAEAGGEWAELAAEAAVHEAALRALITSQALPPTRGGRRNIAAELVALRSERVVVSVPDAPVLLAARTATELLAAVREAVRNVQRHAGEDATAWLFLEDLAGQVAVTVRDDGAGIRPDRLAEAAAEGRLGIAESIRGRIAELGGTVRIDSAPGAGTEIEIMVPAGTGEGSAE